MEHSELLLDYDQEPQDPEQYLASAGNRLANYILDRIGAYVLVFLVISVSEVGYLSEGLSGAFLLLSLLAYWVLFEYFLGKTPAKFLTRTKVVTRDGRRPSFLAILGRTFCRLIPFEQFSFLGSRAVGWHDSLSQTRVVMDEFPVWEE